MSVCGCVWVWVVVGGVCPLGGRCWKGLVSEASVQRCTSLHSGVHICRTSTHGRRPVALAVQSCTHRCAQVCTVVHKSAQLCASPQLTLPAAVDPLHKLGRVVHTAVHKSAGPCTSRHSCAQVRTAVHKSTQLCTNLHNSGTWSASQGPQGIGHAQLCAHLYTFCATGRRPLAG